MSDLTIKCPKEELVCLCLMDSQKVTRALFLPTFDEFLSVASGDSFDRKVSTVQRGPDVDGSGGTDEDD